MGSRVIHRSRTSRQTPRTTAAEVVLGPVAGALVGFAVFAFGAVIIGALIGSDEFGLPDQDWESLGFGASVGAGLLLFVGFLYGGFVAGRLGGVGQHGIALGFGTFLVGAGVAALAGWVVQAGADAEQAQQYASTLRSLGVPGDLDGWRDIATTAGVSAVAGMLLGALAGGALAHRNDSGARQIVRHDSAESRTTT